jgi:hypothetical protein
VTRFRPLLDIAALRGSEVHDRPCWWAYHRAVFATPEIATGLQASFPDKGYAHFVRPEGSKRHDLRGRHLLPPDRERGLNRLWHRLSAELHGEHYRLTLCELANIDLRGLDIEITLWRQEFGGFADPHLDNPAKRLINLIYLSDPDWKSEEGGCLRFLRSKDIDDVEAEILPHLGTSVVFLRSETSWHGYKPIVTTERPRLAVQVVFHTPDLVYGSGRPSRSNA